MAAVDPHINPESGVWDDNFYAKKYGNQPSTGGSSGGSSGAASSPDVSQIAQQMLKMYQDMAKPAISSLEASIPEIQAKYSGERSRLQASQPSLEARYDSLISTIRGNQAQEEKRTTIAQSNELGRRGISAQSGLFDQTINQALSPITQQYSGMITNAGLSREDAIRQLQDTISQLISQEVEATRGVRNNIGALQSATSKDAINSALSMYSLQQQAMENALNRSLSQQSLDETSRQNAIQNALAQAKFDAQNRVGAITPNKANDPTKLQTMKVTDASGNEKVLGIDPLTGEVKVLYENKPPSVDTGNTFSLGDIYNNAVNTARNWWDSITGK